MPWIEILETGFKAIKQLDEPPIIHIWKIVLTG